MNGRDRFGKHAVVVAVAAATVMGVAVLGGCYEHVVSEQGMTGDSGETIYQPNVKEPGDDNPWQPAVGAASDGIEPGP